ncbi:NAD(P)-dependent oxidoreductase [uncultured Friedmanniella sp.]|uniref:NAD(P)-dependent oxidoreductase n=1 Tax=uncultured Friedmanniella sp. TaxID=335381 RepID=UPI0035C9CAA8
MNIVVLGATGATGRLLIRRAFDRGHAVTAVARNPDRLELTRSARLEIVVGDVMEPASIAPALQRADVVLSALGVTKGSPPDLLTRAARVVATDSPTRIIWLSAFGTGGSTVVAGPLTRLVLRLALARERQDKADADSIVAAAGGVLVHAGPLTNGPLASHWHAVPLTEVSRLWMPRPISRATVAAVMLDEAERGDHRGQIVLPLAGPDTTSH